MTDQVEFDRLRQTCSARLKLFSAAARKTELSIQQLRMPVSVDAANRVFSERGAEFEAYENYHLASMQLRDFLGQHSYNVH
jgi:hypothetical protein